MDLETRFTSKTGGKLAEGEEGFPDVQEADQDEEPELNMGLLNMVLQMGIPENPAKHALYKSGNSDADLAVTWYFENMGDDSINQPLRVKKAGGAAKKDDGGPPQEMVD